VRGPGAVGWSTGIAVVAGYTGWIGGELLVYHSGMAVEAAAEGCSSPPLARVECNPLNLTEAMDELRSSWAAVDTSLAYMVIQKPDSRRFDHVLVEARLLEGLAVWLRTTPAFAGHQELTRGKDPPLSPSAAGASLGNPTQPQRDNEGVDRSQFDRMALELEQAASHVRDGARQQDIRATVASAGQAESVCAACHAVLRRRRCSARQGSIPRAFISLAS
jgi:hypothetical protein